MLTHTPQQRQLLIHNWSTFNQRQQAMARAFNINSENAALVGNASPVTKDVWGEWDRDFVEVQRSVLAVFNDLAMINRPIPIGKIVHYFGQVSDSGSANVSLDGRSKARTDQPTIAYQGTPIPIIDSAFSFGWRQWAAAATEGYALDPAARDNANRRVAETLEDHALNGNSQIVVGGAPLYGLRNHPKRSTRSTGVNLNGETGAQWSAEINAVLKLLHAKNYRVPATLYLNWDDWFYASNTDYSTAYPNKTILQRIMEIAGVEKIVPASSVSADEIIAVVKDRRVIQVLNAMAPSTRAQFRANPEDDYNFVAMAAAAVEIKYDTEDQCGIAHST